LKADTYYHWDELNATEHKTQAKSNTKYNKTVSNFLVELRLGI